MSNLNKCIKANSLYKSKKLVKNYMIKRFYCYYALSIIKLGNIWPLMAVITFICQENNMVLLYFSIVYF